jgi:hypothetical protein
MPRVRKVVLVSSIAVLVLLVLVVIVVPLFAARPLRAVIERQVNTRLKGYTARVGAVGLFPPWNLTLKLRDVSIVQQAHPDPPVADIDLVGFKLEWSALLHGKIVGDMLMRQPRLHIDLTQLQAEAKSGTKFQDKGWQEAIEAIYPLKINELRLENGSLTYIQGKNAKPLEMEDVQFIAFDIRNVRSTPGNYPSPVQLRARLFGQGAIAANGHADFLAEPHVGIRTDATIENVPLDRLNAITQDYHLSLRGGVLGAKGEIEYAPKVQRVDLVETTISGLHVRYELTPAGEAQREQAKRKTVEAAKEAKAQTTLQLALHHLALRNTEFVLHNPGTNPAYTLFIDHTNLDLRNLTNHGQGGPALFDARGAFMGSGKAQARGEFRPDVKGADFQVNMAIENTQLATLNPLLTAYGKFDVKSGLFSIYSQIRVKDGYIDGYIKPLFSEMEVYDPEKDRNKDFVHKVYEHLIQGLANLLKNRPREEVATIAPFRGRVGDAKASTWQVIGGLLRNAFFDAILPGFEREAGVLVKSGKGVRRADEENAAQAKTPKDNEERTGSAR